MAGFTQTGRSLSLRQLTAHARRGPPSWVPAGAFWTLNFQLNRYWIKPGFYLGFAPAFLAWVDSMGQYADFNALVSAGHASFARASIGLALNAAGAYVAFASGEPRITDRGLLLEPARINIVANNRDDAHASILLTDVTRAATAPAYSPAGDAFGKAITQGGATNASHAFFITSGPIAGQRDAISVAFKYTASARYLRVSISDNVSSVHACWIDLLTGAVSDVTAGAAVSVTNLANGWMLLSLITGLWPATQSSNQVSIIVSQAMGSTTRVAGSYRMWAGQYERAADFSTSPIITNGLPAARAADALTFTVPPLTGNVEAVYADDSTEAFSLPAGPWAIPARTKPYKSISGMQP